MPRVDVAALSTALPVLVILAIMISLLSHSCIYWSRWEDFNSLYQDTYNKRGRAVMKSFKSHIQYSIHFPTDIPLLLVLFIIISITVLFGGLHMYLRTVYYFALFIIMNIIQVQLHVINTYSTTIVSSSIITGLVHTSGLLLCQFAHILMEAQELSN